MTFREPHIAYGKAGFIEDGLTASDAPFRTDDKLNARLDEDGALPHLMDQLLILPGPWCHILQW
jgi:hypothetical protein